MTSQQPFNYWTCTICDDYFGSDLTALAVHMRESGHE